MVISLVQFNHGRRNSLVLYFISITNLIDTLIIVEWTFEFFDKFVDSLALILVEALMRLIYIFRLLIRLK